MDKKNKDLKTKKSPVKSFKELHCNEDAFLKTVPHKSKVKSIKIDEKKKKKSYTYKSNNIGIGTSPKHTLNKDGNLIPLHEKPLLDKFLEDKTKRKHNIDKREYTSSIKPVNLNDYIYIESIDESGLCVLRKKESKYDLTDYDMSELTLDSEGNLMPLHLYKDQLKKEESRDKKPSILDILYYPFKYYIHAFLFSSIAVLLGIGLVNLVLKDFQN